MVTRSSQIDRIYPMKMFRENAANAVGLNGQMTDSDLAILLTNLARDKGVIVYNSEVSPISNGCMQELIILGQVVKFKASGESSTALSSQDKTIASLKVLIADLSMQVELLSNRISELAAVAQRAIGKKDRTSALAALKSKTLNEGTLAQRTETLAQLEEVFHKIEQATDQVAIVEVMEASTTVLRSLRAETGGVWKVEEIVDDLRDEMSKVDEVGNVIEEAGPGSAAIDEDAVDEELEQMMQEAEAKEEEKEAQRTKRRLAQIKGSQDAIHEGGISKLAPSPTEPIQTAQDLVDTGVDALKRLSLDEDPTLRGEPSTSVDNLAELAPGG